MLVTSNLWTPIFVILCVIVASCIHASMHIFSKQLLKELKTDLCKYLRYTLTMDYGQRRTQKYNFKEPKIEGLLSLIDEIESLEDFRKKYWTIIALMKTKMKDGLIFTLVQFYDPLYHCFTFLEF